jgi:hypothetical protein
MFGEIFVFELKYRLKKPGVYIYFLVCFAFAFMAFAMGALPLQEKEYINSPSAIANYVTVISMVLMLASSAIMGVPLYRDIEYNTREYYLSYPVTKAGYFWGRYLGSFVFVFLFGIAVMLGIFCGTKLGPLLGWQDQQRYGPNHFIYYLQPFLTLALPNLIFTSSLFFGLVAVFRSVKVIYSSGILLLLGYILSHFFTHASTNQYVIHLSDAFAINSVQAVTDNLTVPEKNSLLVPVKGLYLANRLLWTGIGIVILLYTWFRFSFEKFFSPPRQRKTNGIVAGKNVSPVSFTVTFGKRYNRPVLFTLTKIELLNIIRDNYFWIIIVTGSIFLGFIFTHGMMISGVRNYPRTGLILFLFTNHFLIFIFCIIIFYTGEVIHRERSTGYAYINDALPPAVWVFNLAKILSILCLALFLIMVPAILGLAIQLSRGFYSFNFPVYFKLLILCTLPRLVEWTMLSFVLHICLRNKFAALGVGIVFIVLSQLSSESGYFNYNLLLYSYGPGYVISDFDVIGHMLKPVSWFNIYWLLCGSLLLIIGYLFYIRGTVNSFKERRQLAKERFRGFTVTLTLILFLLFIATGTFNYYNVSYLNHYYTIREEKAQQAEIEKKLKHYEDMPLPKMIDLKMTADLFPENQTARFNSSVTMVNKTIMPIDELLLDGDNLTDYTLLYKGNALPYSVPLLFPRGKFNLLGPAFDSSGYRLYHLPQPMAPGDTLVMGVTAIKSFKGFSNGLYAANFLFNGSVMGLGLPGLGYDDDEELRNEDDRKKYGLPKRNSDFPADKETEGANRLLENPAHDLFRLELTVSTSGDQTVVGPGTLEKQWKENGRNYFKYSCTSRGIYTSPGVLSARYAVVHDSVEVEDNRSINIDLYYHPAHFQNVQHFINAYRAALPYYSKAFGPYPYPQIRIAESTIYAPWSNSMTGTNMYGERYGWSAEFKDPNQFDYCYYAGARQLARQWWGEQVAPNHTRGAEVISDGLSRYCAYVLCEKKYGSNNMRKIVEGDLGWYIWDRRWHTGDQHAILHALYWMEKDIKAGHILFGLKDLIGEDSINAALHEFYDLYAFKAEPPFAGVADLYRCLKKHVPDSLQYYMEDSWEKITFYDNRILEAGAIALDSNHYKVTVTCSTSKTYVDEKGDEKPAGKMNDYIDIAVFGDNTVNKQGRVEMNPLYQQKYRLGMGTHTISVVVTGKPASVGIDPYLKLIDKIAGDNMKICTLKN